MNPCATPSSGSSTITVSTIAGTPGPGVLPIDGVTAVSFIYNPMAIVADSCGSLYVADYNHFIRKIYVKGTETITTTFAGTALPSLINTVGNNPASFNYPQGLAIDSSDTIYVADTFNHVIRKITPQGVVTTMAGTGTASYLDSSSPASATFRYPTGVAVDSAGNVYVADKDNSVIRKITAGGGVSTLAGSTSGSTDGTGTAAKFSAPWSIAADSVGNIYVADTGNHTIRKITAGGVVTTVAGLAGNPGNTNGIGSCARFNAPTAVVVDPNGILYVCDRGNSMIRKITLSSSTQPPSCTVTNQNTATVTTVAGTGAAGNANGASAQFNTPYGMCMNRRGTLYVADTANQTIRMISLPASIPPQPTTCATLCKPCCPGMLAAPGSAFCSPYPGFIIGSGGKALPLARGFYQNDTNTIWAAAFIRTLPPSLNHNSLTSLGNLPGRIFHLFPDWVAFGYTFTGDMNLDTLPYTGTNPIRPMTYMFVIISQAELTYTTVSAQSVPTLTTTAPSSSKVFPLTVIP